MSRDRDVVGKVLASLKNIGSFDLSPLREDATGACYRAVDPARRIQISLRTSWPADFPNPDAYREKLLAQARAAQAIEHDHLAKVIGAGELDGACFIVSTFIEGHTLRHDLWNGEPLSAWDLIDFARQACTGLEIAHSRGAVHHALHPGNMAIELDESLKLLDLGLFRANRAGIDPFHAAALYLAPEQLEGHAADRATNFYSVAVMLYEIAAGKQPFIGNSWEQLKASHAGPLVEPIKIRSSVPPGINAAIMKALSRDRNARFQTGPELVRALETYKEFGKPVSVPAPPKPIAAEPLRPKPVSVGGGTAAAPAMRNPYAFVSGLAAASPEKIEVKAGALPPPTPESPPVLEPEEPLAPPPPTKAQIARAAAEQAAHSAWGATSKQLRRVDPWIYGLAALVIVVVVLIGRTVVASFQGHASTASYEQPAPAAPSAPPQQVEQPQPQPDTAAVAEPPEQQAQEAALEPGVTVTIHRGARKLHASKIASAPVSVITGSVLVTTVPQGARVTVDGRADQSFTTPQLIAQLQPGMHTVSIAKDGYTPVAKSVAVSVGMQSNLTVELEASPALLTVASTPAAAFIVIDGVNTGRVTPAQVNVSGGTHTLTLRKLGYLESNQTLSLRSGEQQSRSVDLLEAGSTADIRVVAPAGSHKLFGKKVNGVRVTVNSNPAGASVLINGQTVSKTAPVDFGLNPGNYVLELRLDGYKPVQKTITVEAGKPLSFNENLQQ